MANIHKNGLNNTKTSILVKHLVASASLLTRPPNKTKNNRKTFLGDELSNKLLRYAESCAKTFFFLIWWPLMAENNYRERKTHREHTPNAINSDICAK